MDSGTITLLKSAMLDVGGVDRMLVIYSYHTERVDGSVMKTVKGLSFYKCDACIKTQDEWFKFAEGLRNSNPAAILTTEDLGIKTEDGSNYKIYYGDKFMTRANFFKWIKLKIKRTISLGKWTMGSAFSAQVSFIRILNSLDNSKKYDIITENDIIPRGEWIGAIKEKQPRKKPKIIK